MIAQPVFTQPNPIKTVAAQLPPATTKGFLDLLPIDSSLTALAQNTGGTGVAAPQPANKNTKLNDSSASPTIAPGPTPATPIADSTSGQSATSAPQGVIAAAPAQAAAPDPNPNAPGAATAALLGASEIDARVAAGATVYTSHPNTTLASVPPHLLQAPDTQDQTAPAGIAAPAASEQKTAPDAASQPQAPATAAAATPATGGQKAAPDGASQPQSLAASEQKAAPDAASQPQAAATATGSTAATATATGSTAATTPQLPANHQPPTDASGSFARAVVAASDRTQNATDGSDATAPATTATFAQPPSTITAPQATDTASRGIAPYIPVGEQVAISLKQAATANTDEIRIQLKPASLGAIDVKLNVAHDGRVTAVISADRSDTLNILKQDSGNLQQALRDAGLNADAGSLSFNLRGDGQSFAQNAPQSGSGANAAIAASDTPSAGAAAPASRQHTGSVDIQV